MEAAPRWGVAFFAELGNFSHFEVRKEQNKRMERLMNFDHSFEGFFDESGFR
jgi:hypothetical protein